MYMARDGCTDMVALLLVHGADVNQVDSVSFLRAW